MCCAPKKINLFQTNSGRFPFVEWIEAQEVKTQIVVDRFLKRVAVGGAKKSIKSLGDGVFEIKIPYKSGLRIYFAEDGDRIIILLIGGDKRTQKRDIMKAKKYWSENGKSK